MVEYSRDYGVTLYFYDFLSHLRNLKFCNTKALCRIYYNKIPSDLPEYKSRQLSSGSGSGSGIRIDHFIISSSCFEATAGNFHLQKRIHKSVLEIENIKRMFCFLYKELRTKVIIIIQVYYPYGI
jgi:hypothetical protein